MSLVFLLIAVAGIPPTPDWAEGGHFRLVKKQSQPNPLKVSLLHSERYIILKESKPIDVNLPYFSVLERKNAVFSRKMNGAILPTPDLRRKEIGNSKIETRNRRPRKLERNWNVF